MDVPPRGSALYRRERRSWLQLVPPQNTRRWSSRHRASPIKKPWHASKPWMQAEAMNQPPILFSRSNVPCLGTAFTDPSAPTRKLQVSGILSAECSRRGDGFFAALSANGYRAAVTETESRESTLASERREHKRTSPL